MKDSVNDTRRSCLPKYPCGPSHAPLSQEDYTKLAVFEEKISKKHTRSFRPVISFPKRGPLFDLSETDSRKRYARARMNRSEAFRSFEETVALIKIARVHLAPYITITRRRHDVLAITKINCVPRCAETRLK